MLEEFKKAQPPTLDGEVKKDEEVEAWMLGVKKYFRCHNYSKNMKERVSIFSLKGEDDIWWEYLRNVNHIMEK